MLAPQIKSKRCQLLNHSGTNLEREDPSGAPTDDGYSIPPCLVVVNSGEQGWERRDGIVVIDYPSAQDTGTSWHNITWCCDIITDFYLEDGVLTTLHSLGTSNGTEVGMQSQLVSHHKPESLTLCQPA